MNANSPVIILIAILIMLCSLISQAAVFTAFFSLVAGFWGYNCPLWFAISLGSLTALTRLLQGKVGAA
ncbi:hypothetical protein [Sphingomonas sp. R1]|uniref:hypothetical protein n=1 Tax=Sphingomonas sp. R1 TaxID=399176 RepID=UPI0022249CDC|nr:hypothetical protein [Sphingomonas sp. R1]UYY77517.1 hypothetical protein OIM94_00440 [Sphingomonas sp. R1]